MMDERQEALARRAVGCKTWRWMPGMLGWSHDADSPCVRCLGEDALGYDLWWDAEANEALLGDPTDLLPDLTDPATLGCLLALVLELYPCGVSLGHTPLAGGSRRWHESEQISCALRFDDDTERFSRYGSIGEALVAALEAAP